MSSFTPIDLLWQEGVRKDYLAVTGLSINKVLREIGAIGRFHVERIGPWRSDRDIAEDSCSVERILSEARTAATDEGYADDRPLVTAVSRRILCRPWRDGAYSIAVLVVRDDYVGFGEEYMFGAASTGQCATASTYRFEHDGRIGDRLGLFETLLCHELGHVFGAPDGRREEALQQWCGAHCTNVCIMRQQDDLPDWEARVLPDVRPGSMFCDLCQKDIQRFLREHLG